jgi:hydrogenase nickel incorporation protein HypA/HybF
VHELAITQSMLQLAMEHAERAGARRITRIHLVIGKLSGIVDDSVQFYFDFMSQGTLAEGAQLTFERRPVRWRCWACDQEFEPQDDDWACPACQSPGGDVVAGREFYMDSIEVE